jgi:hypothetical protein
MLKTNTMKKTLIFMSLFLICGFQQVSAGASEPSSSITCLSCAVPDGLIVSNLTDSSATLSWNAVSGATKYSIEVEDEQNSSGNFQLETSVTGSSYSLSGLTPGVTYKFKVRAYCGSDKSNWSEWKYFVASNSSNGGGNGACVAPVSLSIVVGGSNAILSWQNVSGALKYYLEVEDEQNNPSNFHLEDSTNTNSYILTGLQAGVLYKFKVRTLCAGGQSAWSEWLFFNGSSSNGNTGNNGSSLSCGKPTGAKAQNISTNSALLTWDAVPGISSYTLEIERHNHGPSPWTITQITQTNSFLLTGLNPNSRYKFKVRSNCTGGGHSAWTKWERFKTLSNAPDVSLQATQQEATADRTESISPDATATLEMRVWPNPAQTTSNVRLQNLHAGAATLRLFDLAGHLIQERQIQPEGAVWEGTLTLNDLQNGLYLLQMQNGAYTQTVKLVLNR